MNQKLIFLASTFLPLSLTADTIFSQNFESGSLSADEKVFGNFEITEANAPLNNGTKMMGHSSSYGPLDGGVDTPQPSYSYYEVRVDLRGYTDIQMTVEVAGGVEHEYDGFNVLGNLVSSQLRPPAGLLTPTGDSELQHGTLDYYGLSSIELGPLAWNSPPGENPSEVTKVTGKYDLEELAGEIVNLRFQFGTDAEVGGQGVNFDNILIEGIPIPDMDGDGMDDVYEERFGLDKAVNDANGDLDGDGLTNIEEYNRGTRPDLADTDGDGLSDKVESGSGTYADAGDTGTSPIFADSDSDSILDGLEDNSGIFNGFRDPGTDPNAFDTDLDGFDDSYETAFRSDPLDAGVVPSLPKPIAYWPFDDGTKPVTRNVFDSRNNGFLSGGANYVSGHSGRDEDRAIVFDGVDDAVTTSEAIMNGLTEFTLSGWVKFTEEQTIRSGFFGQQGAVELGLNEPEKVLAFSPAGGGIFADLAPSAKWVHVVLTSDENDRKIYFNGVEAANGDSAGLVSSDQFFNIGGAGIFDIGFQNFFEGEIDDVAVWGEALSSDQINLLTNDEVTPAGFVSGVQLRIVDFIRNAKAGSVRLVWISRPNRTYQVQVSNDLITFENVGDVLLATSQITSLSVEELVDGSSRKFYRIVEAAPSQELPDQE